MPSLNPCRHVWHPTPHPDRNVNVYTCDGCGAIKREDNRKWEPGTPTRVVVTRIMHDITDIRERWVALGQPLASLVDDIGTKDHLEMMRISHLARRTDADRLALFDLSDGMRLLDAYNERMRHLHELAETGEYIPHPLRDPYATWLMNRAHVLP